MNESDLEKWDTLGMQYWQHRNDKQMWAHEYILFPEFLRLVKGVPCQELLDYGCGDGGLLNYFRFHGISSNCYGYDKSSVLLQIAKKTYPNEKYLESIINNSFDAICMNMVIQDVSEPLVLLNEIGKIINENGLLIFSIPHPVFSLVESQHLTTVRKVLNPSRQKDFYRYRFEETEEVFWDKQCKTSTYLFNRTISTYSGLIKSSGFSILDITEPYPVEAGIVDAELYAVHKSAPRFLFFVVCKK